MDLLKRVYGEALQEEPECEYRMIGSQCPLTLFTAGFSASVVVDLRAPDADDQVKKAALIKRHCFAAVFDKFFTAQEAGESVERAVVDYRDGETLYVAAQPDRVTVIFSTLFKDED